MSEKANLDHGDDWRNKRGILKNGGKEAKKMVASYAFSEVAPMTPESMVRYSEYFLTPQCLTILGGGE